MKKFEPKDSNPLKEFAELERWVTAIMKGAKTSGNKNVFAKGIPDIQWEEFEATEEKKKRKTRPEFNFCSNREAESQAIRKSIKGRNNRR